MTGTTTEAVGLTQLQARLEQDLAWLELPAKRWVVAREIEGVTVLEVAVIGGGMAGMAAAASLTLTGIQAVIFDRAPVGQEGPWVTTARMQTLRSPKQLTGPALGLPALTFRAWFEAQFGLQAWIELDKIPRTQWMDYLRWYRQALKLELRNDHHVTNIEPRTDGLVRLEVDTPSGKQTIYARRVVLATGRDGLGGAYVPEIATTIPHEAWAHSSDFLDYATLAGKRVGVVGAGASAMDSAATALEAGAKSVDLLIRRTDLPRINKGKGAGNAGMVIGFVDLPEHWKWRIRHYLGVEQVPAPRGSTLRVSKHPNAYFNFGCSLESVSVNGKVLSVNTPQGTFELDFLIFSTGFKIDWWARPEYANIAPHVLNWKQRLAEVNEPASQEMLDSPDLGSAFEFKEVRPGACPGLSSIHCFCYPAALSHGTVSGDIPAISEGAKRLSAGIASLFYREDIAEHFHRMELYDDAELLGDEWTPAIRRATHR
jgi:cation diffusion facilitator CzcD-associated flavoprotein CzcO